MKMSGLKETGKRRLVVPSRKTRVCDVGVKQCTKCCIELPLSEFYPQRKYKRKDGGITTVYISKCKKCELASIKKRRIKSHGSLVLFNRSQKLKALGLTLEDWDKLYSEQKGVCFICSREFDCVEDGRVNLDHCHQKNIPRKLLCSPCNKGLGHFQDNPQRLRIAADYLEMFSDD